MYKYFKNEKGEIINEVIPTDKMVNREVVRKIRQKYDINKEFQMQRLGMIDPANAEYQEYLSYVEECITWGINRKLQARTDREKWKDYQWNEEVETREEFIQRLKEAGMI